MGRTLRGFEEEFPYSIRGDVSDAHLLDEEEAYGQQDLFGAIGDAVANRMAQSTLSRSRRRLMRPAPMQMEWVHEDE